MSLVPRSSAPTSSVRLDIACAFSLPRLPTAEGQHKLLAMVLLLLQTGNKNKHVWLFSKGLETLQLGGVGSATFLNLAKAVCTLRSH